MAAVQIVITTMKAYAVVLVGFPALILYFTATETNVTVP